MGLRPRSVGFQFVFDVLPGINKSILATLSHRWWRLITWGCLSTALFCNLLGFPLLHAAPWTNSVGVGGWCRLGWLCQMPLAGLPHSAMYQKYTRQLHKRAIVFGSVSAVESDLYWNPNLSSPTGGRISVTPKAGSARCAVGLALDIDPVGLVRRKLVVSSNNMSTTVGALRPPLLNRPCI